MNLISKCVDLAPWPPLSPRHHLLDFYVWGPPKPHSEESSRQDHMQYKPVLFW